MKIEFYERVQKYGGSLKFAKPAFELPPCFVFSELVCML